MKKLKIFQSAIMFFFFFGLLLISGADLNAASTTGLEKILTPGDIKNYTNIIKEGTSLYGVKITATSSTVSNGLEKILTPGDIKNFKNIVKKGTALYGVRITNAPASNSITVKDKLINQEKLKKFTNFQEYKDFISNNYTVGQSYQSSRGFSTFDSVEMLAAPMANMAKSADSAASGEVASSDYSKTNVQIEGVDEADIIKTDGLYAYALVDKELFIIKALPASDAKIVSKIVFRSRPEDLYINGNSLVVFGSDDQVYSIEAYKRFTRRPNFTFFKVFDIADKTNPKQVRDLNFEGSYYNSRMIGDYVYFLTNEYRYPYEWENEILVPRVMYNDKEINFCVGQVRCPNIYYFDMPYNNYNYINLASINVKDNSQNFNNEIFLLSDSQNMFVSPDNIYITYTKYLSDYDLSLEVVKEMIYPKLSQVQKDWIAKIEATDNVILSVDEKNAKIMAIIEIYIQTLSDADQTNLESELEIKMKQKYQDISKELQKTVIHKIGIDQGKIEYKTFGTVTGQVLNQFSMDEKDGYFRIATTKNRTWSAFASDTDANESYSNLYVLDKDMKVVGSVEKLAAGESIYSVRFMQNRAYMVTFEQVDPLFVIDLANPTQPKVMGQLKIPGFSNYLHPYDDNTLIGFGKETEVNQWGGVTTKGLKFSLFDVSDIANPKEIATYVLGDQGSNSIALNDHKAFLFSQAKNLLVVPVTLMEKGSLDAYSKLTFSGAAVLKVDKTGFILKGKIDHSDGGVAGIYEGWYGYDYYDNSVKRSFYIDDTLYTFSSKYLQANKISDLTQVKKLELKVKEPDFKVVN